MIRRVCIKMAGVVLALSTLAIAQDNAASTPATNSAGTSAEIIKAKGIKEQIKDYEEKKKKAKKRIEEIDAIIEPAKLALVPKIFEITPQEYQVLKLQSEATASAKKYFVAKDAEVTNTKDSIAQYFDEAYQAIKAGYLWFGQESSLVDLDVGLYEKMQEQLTDALASTAKGSEYKALLDEKREILEGLKIVDPILKYHIERRNWFRFFSDYKGTLEDAVTESKQSQK